MALTSEKKYFGQMMNSQKPQAGCIQVDIREEATVTDYRIPFRAISTANQKQDDSFDEGQKLVSDEQEPPKIALSFTLADGKRQGCKNLKLDEHGIELCLRQPNLSLPANRSKALSLRVIRAASNNENDPSVA